MKSVVFIFLFFSVGVMGQIVNIPDPNFKTYLKNFYFVDTDGDGFPDTDADTNEDGEIQVSEALAVTSMQLGSPITDLTGIEAFTNMTQLKLRFSSLTTVNFNLMPQLTSLEISGNNSLMSVDFSPLVNLRTLVCEDNSYLANVNLSGLTQLVSAKITYSRITSLNISNLSSLENLNCDFNLLTSLTINGNPSLNSLNCMANQLTSLDLTQAPNLTSVNCGGNSINTLLFAGLLQLQTLGCSQNMLTSLDLTGFPNLTKLVCSNNQLTSLSVASVNTLTYLDFGGNMLSSIDLNGLGNLTYLSCNGNQLPSIDLGPTPLLTTLHCEGNLFSSLDINMLPLLTELTVGNAGITGLNIAPQVALQRLSVTGTGITSLDLSTQTQLTELVCTGNNSLTALDFSHNTLLNRLNLSGAQITTIDLGMLPLLTSIAFAGMGLTTLDLSQNPILEDVNINNLQNLEAIFMKNGDLRSWMAPFLYNCPSLRYICEDESSMATTYGMNFGNNLSSLLEVNSYCSFNPGGNYNTLTGIVRYDLDNNGCNSDDFVQSYTKVRIDDGSQTGATFTHDLGEYTFYTQSGNFILTPELENPTYFNIAPPNATLNFPTVNNSTQTQDFCLSANGVHPDLEVTFMPSGNARPGYNADYTLVYKNKGNQILSGNVTLNYESNKLDFISTFPEDNFELNPDQILWNFTNLLPFETRSINLTLAVSAPPIVNDGDLLHFVAAVNPIPGDETPTDNTFGYDQLVVNSLDPNRIECLEGGTIAPEDLGKYLHYNIDFENVGTADAVNVVVRTTINATKFNANSLQLQYASHEMETKMTGNVVEFIFKNIHLQPSSGPIGGHGNVLFKVKTLPGLIIGDEVMGTASIFFDYNAPIDTNEARTLIASMKNPDFIVDQSIAIAPNPVKDIMSISARGELKSVQLFDAQGRILQTVLEHQKSATLDLSNRACGVYFVKVITQSGAAVEKIIKDF